MSRSTNKRQKDKARREEFKLRKQQEQEATRYAFQTSFHDKLIQEIVCTQTPNQIDQYIKSTLNIDTPQVFFSDNAGWTDGLVMVSSLTYSFIPSSLS